MLNFQFRRANGILFFIHPSPVLVNQKRVTDRSFCKWVMALNVNLQLGWCTQPRNTHKAFLHLTSTHISFALLLWLWKKEFVSHIFFFSEVPPWLPSKSLLSPSLNNFFSEAAAHLTLDGKKLFSLFPLHSLFTAQCVALLHELLAAQAVKFLHRQRQVDVSATQWCTWKEAKILVGFSRKWSSRVA